MSCTKPKMTKVQMKVSNSTCRVCMRKNNSMKELFGSDCKIVDRIQFCTGILFTENPILPSFICTECLSQLDIAHNFKTTCIHTYTEEILKKMEVKVEIGEEIFDDTTVMEEIEYLDEDEAEIEYLKEDVRLLSSNYTKKIVTPSLNSTKKVVKEPSSNSTKNTKKQKDKCKEKEKAPQKTVPYIFRKSYCSKCNIRFKTIEESFEHHKTLHNKSKIVCEVCGKQYFYRWSFSVHKRVHSENSLECKHCPYIALSKSDLKTHLIKHTGEKKILCHLCPGTFRSSACFLTHMNHNHRPKTYHCNRCDKSFYNRASLNLHIDAHDNIKRNECEVCHKFFARRYRLKSHMLKEHAIQTPPSRPGRPRKQSEIKNELK